MPKVSVGRVAGSHALCGAVKVTAWDAADVRANLSLLARIRGRPERPLVVSSVRARPTHLIVRFEGIGDAESAAALTGAELFADVSALKPIPPGVYRDTDLQGFSVTDRRLGHLGQVVGVAHYPAYDALLVGARRAIVPLLHAYGVHVEAGSREVHTKLPEGYEELL